MFQEEEVKNYSLTDSQKRQYRGGEKGGYYIYPLEKISAYYDKRGLEDYIYLVQLNKESKLQKVVNGFYAENVTLIQGRSLLSPQTYLDLELPLNKFLTKKVFLSSLVEDRTEDLDFWFSSLRDEKEFFLSYLEQACREEKFKTLDYLVKKSRQDKFSLHFWPCAERFTSSSLCNWFFRYAIENYDLPYARLAIKNSLENDRSLLLSWKEYILQLAQERSSWNVEIPPCIERVLQGGVEDLFTDELGDYCSPNYQLDNLDPEQLEFAFREARSFTFSAQLLDNASLKGDIPVLNFFLKKALKYGKSFLPYSLALDNAAFKGHLQVLEFWSYASSLFNFPLFHSSKLLLYSIHQKRVDILYWWKKYSGKGLTLELVYAAIKEDSLPLLKFFVSLDYSYRKNWFNFSRYVLSSTSGERIEWWLREGHKQFLTI